MLRRRLKDLSSELIGNHPTADCGGCCVVAAHVARYLSQHVPTKIVVGNYRRADLDKIRPNTNPLNKDEWEENGIDFDHVLVEFKEGNRWYTFDSTYGVKQRNTYWSVYSNWIKVKGTLTIKEATALANSPVDPT